MSPSESSTICLLPFEAEFAPALGRSTEGRSDCVAGTIGRSSTRSAGLRDADTAEISCAGNAFTDAWRSQMGTDELDEPDGISGRVLLDPEWSRWAMLQLAPAMLLAASQ